MVILEGEMHHQKVVNNRREILRKIRPQRGTRAALGHREEPVNLMGREAHELDSKNQ